MKSFIKYSFLILLLVLLFGCEDLKGIKSAYEPAYSETSKLQKKSVYIFGVHPLHNPKRLFDVYQPMVDFINEHLDDSELRLEASRDYPAYDKKLFSGHFHFALPNPYQTVTAEKNGYTIFGKMGDDENFRGIILVRRDSHIHELKDLKGEKISYPAPTALAGTMMPQWYLNKHGIDINKDVENIFVGSQESSIMSVYLGKTAAASTWPPPWKAFIKERPDIAKEVMVKWKTSYLPNNGLVVRNDVPKSLLDQVSKIIFSLHTHKRGREILAAMELSKYEVADHFTYESVRNFLVDFEKEIRPIRLEK